MNSQHSPDKDLATTRALIAKMDEIHRASGNDAPPLLPSVQHGDGLMALLHHRFGGNTRPSNSETEEKLEEIPNKHSDNEKSISVGAQDIHYYIGLLHVAANYLEITPEELEAL